MATIEQGGAAMADLVRRTVAAVNAPEKPHDLPLDVRGTAFQQAVWRELQRIPPGETRTYAQIAAAVGKPGAVRAAGSANGANNRSEEHTFELQSLMRISYAVFCLKKKKKTPSLTTSVFHQKSQNYPTIST